MIKPKHIFIILIPAILIVGLALFIRLLQYESLSPKAKQAQENKTEQDSSIIPIFPDDPIIGDKKAALTIIAFEDFGCEGCGAQMFALKKLLKKYPKKIKIIWKGLAVTKFPYPTRLAHEYAYCANQQGKFKQFSDFAFANYDNLSPQIIEAIAAEINLDQKKLRSCLQSSLPRQTIQQNEQLGIILNIQAVPTIFVDNKQIQNPQLMEEWEMVLGL